VKTAIKKIKTAFFCSQCGTQHEKWQGQCRGCGEWNSLVEEKVSSIKHTAPQKSSLQIKRLPEIVAVEGVGHQTGMSEFDRVLGGTLLPGQTVLLGGEPGIGKSTLLLQAADAYSRQGLSVLYLSGEESLSQIQLRAKRLGVIGENIHVVNCDSVEDTGQLLRNDHYAVALIDSIQTMSSSAFDSPPGSIGQVRESADQLITVARERDMGLFLVGHVTKDGMVAGPKVLEHMVDTVLYFEGDTNHLFRILRAVKNRFGSVREIGVFEMEPQGLIEVANPSALFLAEHGKQSHSGSDVTAVCEGNRALLVEIQALVTTASFGTPQRVAGGFDSKRLALLLAILEKRCGLSLADQDVFVSVVGGLKLTEPAMDLPVLLAVASSLLNKPIDYDTVAFGEAGLAGEVRGVTSVDLRMGEATRMGFRRLVIPKATADQTDTTSVTTIGVLSVHQALDLLLM
jgi:DNA repair protein RadA/Sms